MLPETDIYFILALVFKYMFLLHVPVEINFFSSTHKHFDYPQLKTNFHHLKFLIPNSFTVSQIALTSRHVTFT